MSAMRVLGLCQLLGIFVVVYFGEKRVWATRSRRMVYKRATMLQARVIWKT